MGTMNKYNYILLFCFIFWIAETWYFGWNMKPLTVYEEMCDRIVTIGFIWGVLGDLFSSITFQKKYSVTLQAGQKLEEVL